MNFVFKICLQVNFNLHDGAKIFDGAGLKMEISIVDHFKIVTTLLALILATVLMARFLKI